MEASESSENFQGGGGGEALLGGSSELLKKMGMGSQSEKIVLKGQDFEKMENLPISYFDTHQHGEIMSTYTNDTDTLRQLVGQSLPNLFLSGTTITVIFAMMISFSLWLTLLTIAWVFIMLKVTKKVGGASSKYMIEQQKSLAKEEGFVEEMIKGQKVVSLCLYTG